MLNKHRVITVSDNSSVKEDLDDYTIMLKLHAGSRIPQNDYERRLLKEMQEIEARGKQIDFTENSW